MSAWAPRPSGVYDQAIMKRIQIGARVAVFLGKRCGRPARMCKIVAKVFANDKERLGISQSLHVVQNLVRHGR